MPQEDEGTTSAMYTHICNVYKAMVAEAKPQAFHGDIKSDESTELLVYTGFPTTLITQKLNLPTPYYTTIRTALIDMGCVEIIRRGGGGAPSSWILHQEPTTDLFERVTAGTGRVKSRGDKRMTAVEELMEGLVAQVQAIDTRLRRVEEL